MQGIIISGGTKPSKKLIDSVLTAESIVVCADSGANVAYEYNLPCSTIVGDLDSISSVAESYFQDKGCKFIKYSCEKDYTDTELAINEVIDRGAKSIVILGALGSRIDHSLANIGLIVDYSIKGYDISIIDDHNEIRVFTESFKLHCRKGKVFSLQSFRKNVMNLTIKGAKYPLSNYTLKSGTPLTVSNVFLEEDIDITFNSGIILLIYPKD